MEKPGSFHFSITYSVSMSVHFSLSVVSEEATNIFKTPGRQTKIKTLGKRHTWRNGDKIHYKSVISAQQ